MTVTLDNPICVALDFVDGDATMEVAARVAPHVGMYKVGLTTFATNGPSLVASLARTKPVFLDLKFHDIPTQVHGAVTGAVSTGASYTTVHASGGADMIAAAMDAAGDDLVVLAVTALTSLDDHALARIGLGIDSETVVLRLAELALDAGAPGLVCSPMEVDAVRRRFGARADGGPLLVVPGIRPAATSDDQRRTLGPADAFDAGADVLVIGRPITAAPDQAGAARSIAESLRR
ncbi:MAG TPA: orotidine-5'-phosphate decarboxylase [Actinomycetota bacterium]